MVSLHNPASEPCVNDKQGRRTPGAPGQAISPADISMSIIALFRVISRYVGNGHQHSLHVITALAHVAMRRLIGASGLPDQVCDESAGEAHHKDGCGCHGHQVNGPRVVAFAHKVEVPRATFVSIQVKMHTAASDKAPCTQNTTFYGRHGDA
jgi:hypothetical protein